MVNGEFFYLKALSGSLGSNFSKTTDNETIKVTDIKTVKVNRCSPYKFSFERSYSQDNYKKLVVRRRTNSAAPQLDHQPAYSNKLPIGDKKEADFLDLHKENHVPYFVLHL
jgi:hypothetical protein